MKSCIILFICLFIAVPGSAENYLINGGQESQISYEMVQKIEPAKGTKKLTLSYVIPESFNSPTFKQKVSQFQIRFSKEPNDKKEERDKRGNKIIRAIWKKPTGTVATTINMSVLNSTELVELSTTTAFPLKKQPKDVSAYLRNTEQVPSKDKQILAKARQLTAHSKTEFDAVQQILTWVVDHMKYVLLPKSYDAMYSFQTGKGNCQNYSHLAAALMRAVGIPTRIVNGMTLKQPYDIKTSAGVITMKMAQGRHSWIEVYFPDLGWVPFDPQQTELFVSNRFVRVEVGLDNNETKNDGLVRWTESRGAGGMPKFAENIEASFINDNVRLKAEKQNYGPEGILFCPKVTASFTKQALKKPPPPPPKVPPKKLKTLKYTVPIMFGNLEFPQNIDFLAARGPAQKITGDELEMRKNFLVETAEYVTTQGKQYAQTFMVEKPMRLSRAGLALHNFGGTGQLWLELFNDNGQGMPGNAISTSDLLQTNQIQFSQGYAWVDFEFGNENPLLLPGRYWIAFGFTGSPIVNWFFTYGKPVGPADGTRYKTLFDETWSRSLAFEFNYRVIGMAAE